MKKECRKSSRKWNNKSTYLKIIFWISLLDWKSINILLIFWNLIESNLLMSPLSVSLSLSSLKKIFISSSWFVILWSIWIKILRTYIKVRKRDYFQWCSKIFCTLLKLSCPHSSILSTVFATLNKMNWEHKFSSVYARWWS